MPKLPILSYKIVVKALRMAGFNAAPNKGKGSHLAFVKKENGKTFLVIIPRKTIIPRGTLLSIIEQAGLSKDDFVRLVQKR